MLHSVVVGRPRYPCGMLHIARARSEHLCMWSVIVFHERHRRVAVRSRKWPRVVPERPSEVVTKVSEFSDQVITANPRMGRREIELEK